MIVPKGTTCRIIRARTNLEDSDENNEIAHYLRLNALVHTMYDYDDAKMDFADIGILAFGKDFLGYQDRLIPTEEYPQYTSFKDMQVINHVSLEKAAMKPKMPSI